MAISIDTSRRFMMLRFPLIIGVVCIHAYGFKAGFANGEIGLSQIHPTALLVEDYLSQVIARICVPLFYFISGFLFFVSFGGTAQEYVSKLRARIRSLLIPFLFWNMLVIGLLALAQGNPHSAKYFSGTFAPISSFGPYDYLNALFGLTRNPAAYQFWFIRDLMVLVLLSPFFYLLIKHFTWPALLLLACIWMFRLNFLSYTIASEATLFFFIGGVFAYSGWSLDMKNVLGKWVVLIYLAISIVDVISKHAILNTYVHNTGILLGSISVIWLSGFLGRIDTDKQIIGSPPSWFAKRLARSMEALSPASFFVFAAHEPLLTVIKKLGFSVCKPSNSFSVIALYLMAPVLAILICIFWYLTMRRTVPVFTRVICGGR